MTKKKPKGRRYVMRRLQIKEISGVDRPAQESATALIMKRNDESADRVAKFGNKAALTTSEKDHTHLVPLEGFEGDEIKSGLTTFAHGHDHPFVFTEDGSVVIGWIDGHTHEIDIVGKVDDLVSKEGKSAGLPKNSAGKHDSAGDPGQLEGINMTDKDSKAEVQKLQADLAKANRLATLNDVHKAHYLSLEGEVADNFLNKSAEDRQTELDFLAKAAKEDDPVAYTTQAGIQLRKSAGYDAIEAVKAADVILKQNAELKKQNEENELAKRVEADLKHFPGGVAVRSAILKAVDGIEDEGVREAAHQALKSHDASLSEAFVTKGHGGEAKPSGSATEELDILAKAYEKDNTVSYAAAYSAVLETAKGQELYAKSLG